MYICRARNWPSSEGCIKALYVSCVISVNTSLPSANARLNILLTVKGAIVPYVRRYRINHCHLCRSGDLLWQHHPDGGVLNSLRHRKRRICHCSLSVQCDKPLRVRMIELASMKFVRIEYSITNSATCKTHCLGIHEALQEPIGTVGVLRVRHSKLTQRTHQRLRQRLLVYTRPSHKG